MLIIGIAGGTGSGKTTVVNTLIEQLQHDEVEVISQDSYYRDNSHLSYEERVNLNFDHPQSIDFDLLCKHLSEMRAGKTIPQPVYSFKTHNRTGETVKTVPRKVVLVEGILIFTHPELRQLFDVKLYVHADSDERLIRRLRRDIHERGRDLDEVLNRYQDTLKPMHNQFIEPTKEFADLIIPNNHYNTVAIDLVQTIIQDRLIT